MRNDKYLHSVSCNYRLPTPELEHACRHHLGQHPSQSNGKQVSICHGNMNLTNQCNGSNRAGKSQQSFDRRLSNIIQWLHGLVMLRFVKAPARWEIPPPPSHEPLRQQNQVPVSLTSKGGGIKGREGGLGVNPRRKAKRNQKAPRTRLIERI